MDPLSVDESSQLLKVGSFTPRGHEKGVLADEEYLKDYEILGESRNVQRIKKLFENSSIKIKVVEQQRPSVQDAFAPQEGVSDNKGEDNKGEKNNNFAYNEDDNCNTDNTTFNENNATKKDDVSSEGSSGFDSEEEPGLNSPRPNVSPEIVNRKNMIFVQSRIKNLRDITFITPTRIFLKEDVFFKQKNNPFVFFLFDDLLVITKAKEHYPGTPKQVKFRKALDVKYLEVQPVPDSSSKQNMLKIKYTKSKKRWKRVYSAPTKEQRDAWFVELCKLRDSLRFI